TATPAETAGLALARMGRLLPAVVAVSVDPEAHPALAGWLAEGSILETPSVEIDALVARPGIEVTHAIEAAVPLADAEDARFVFFREGNGFLEHVAILIGAREEWPDPV